MVSSKRRIGFCVSVCVCKYIKEIYLALVMHSNIASLPATTVVSLGPITIAGATNSDSGSVTKRENMQGILVHKSHSCSSII